MFQTYIEHNQAHHDRLIRLFPGMREALSMLHRAGYRLGVVTSKIRDNALRELRTSGLEGLFDSLTSAEDVDRPKPDPEPVERARRSLDLPAADVLLVGDSLYDLQAGRAAGVHTAAALWGPFSRERLAAGEPHYWLHDIDELLELLCVDPGAGRG